MRIMCGKNRFFSRVIPTSNDFNGVPIVSGRRLFEITKGLSEKNGNMQYRRKFSTRKRQQQNLVKRNLLDN